MKNKNTYKIRPAGRHILTIGRDLIQDRYAAIVELVKNAYDADSLEVTIKFKQFENRSGYSICIYDHGHGMSRKTVINKWLVPSTDDKLKRRESPEGRVMQGSKGIGRYAASMLGEDLLLESVTDDGEKTVVFLQWKDFENAQYLDDVDVLVESTKTTESIGTELTIHAGGDFQTEWNSHQLDNLRSELKKLISPVSVALQDNNIVDQFIIYLVVEPFPENQESSVDEKIKPYPIFDLFDYRISGKVRTDGTGLLTYSTQKARNTEKELINVDLNSTTGCGELVFDIRVYDREKDAIDLLIKRGLKDESGNYVGKLEARRMLNRFNGIGVYRNGFRIRPLGDADFDWLKLNEQRIQNPSMRIGSNQVIGYVLIQPESRSGLIEKSARDGLRENVAFEHLKGITKEVINKLETKRFAYRRKHQLSRPALKVERELERLFAFDELKRNIRSRLKKGGVDKDAADEIINIISKEEGEKNKIAEEIRKTVAIYQGQATLGKIINVILHEGRRPLNYFKNQIPNLQYWHESFLKSKKLEKLERLIPMVDGLADNADVFVKLFSRLDPLAAGKRSAKKQLKLKKTLEDAFLVFKEELNANEITFSVRGPEDYRLLSWPQDVYAIFTNLIDNSIFWIKEKKSGKREINIEFKTDGEVLQYLDYRDTGPGIEPDLLASEVIFEPEFSTKTDGMGLGLSIAGEAAARNDLELKAFESDKGAYFRLQPSMEASA